MPHLISSVAGGERLPLNTIYSKVVESLYLLCRSGAIVEAL